MASEKLEAWLYRRGFRVAGARRLVAIQALITAGSCVAALALGWLWPFVAQFAVGAVLALGNFYFLAKFAQGLAVSEARSAAPRQLLRFYGRLLATGAALYLLIVQAGFSVAALLAGLSTVVLTMLVWGLAQMLDKNAKEA